MRKSVVLFLLLIVFLAVSSVALADTAPTTVPVDPRGLGAIETFVAEIVYFLSKVGALVIVGGLLWNGFKLVTSAGNPHTRAEAIAGLGWTVIGGIVVAGAYRWAGAILGAAPK